MLRQKRAESAMQFFRDRRRMGIGNGSGAKRARPPVRPAPKRDGVICSQRLVSLPTLDLRMLDSEMSRRSRCLGRWSVEVIRCASCLDRKAHVYPSELLRIECACGSWPLTALGRRRERAKHRRN